jgi:two-component system, chemotaxis family, CheB/CheR fusion protein
VPDTPPARSTEDRQRWSELRFPGRGEPAPADITLTDLDKRTRGEVATSLLAAIVESSDDAIVSKGLDGVISSWNPAAERLFGYTAREAIGQSVTILIPPDRLDEEGVILDRIRRGEPVEHYETVRLRKDGSPLDVSLTISPVRDSEGRIVGASKICRDITRQKQAEAELREADRRKTEFLAMLAHELRNPLAPIMNALQILEFSGNNAEASAHARQLIGRQVRQMVRLVDDLLDVSRISRGKIVLRRERIALSRVLEEAAEAVRVFFDRKEVVLTVALPEPDVDFFADPARLTQIVGNLLNNACKFTAPGGSVWLRGERDGGAVVIRVRDTGIGVAPDQMERIFDMFAQVDTSLQRDEAGLGIGLTLVKTLIEMHGGTVSIQSDGLGKGTEFAVRLPLVTDTPTTPPSPTSGYEPGDALPSTLPETSGFFFKL